MDIVTNMQPIVNLLGSLLSPLIAITVAYIAYQQWKVNRSKSNREIREAEITIYLNFSTFLRNVDDTGKVDSELHKELQATIARADFLFNHEMREWLREIEIEALCWLDGKKMIESADSQKLDEENSKAREEWKMKELEYMERSIDKLQSYHCELLDKFKHHMQPL